MSRQISFVDGFTSSTPPDVTGSAQEDFLILNNQEVALSFYTIDALNYKSAFISFELSRSETGSEFRQAATMILSYDGTNWLLNVGNYQGSDLINDSLTNPESITLSVSTISGVGSIEYTSGNMGAGYTGTLKASITRIVTV